MKFCLDRYEGAWAVCLCEDQDDRSYDFPRADYPAFADMPEGMVFTAGLTDGRLTDIVPLPKETEERRAAMEQRLRALFRRGKTSPED